MYILQEYFGTPDKYDYFPKDVYTSWRNPVVALPRRVLTFLTVVIPFTIFWLLLSCGRLPSLTSVGPARSTISHWHGWANVENIIALYVINTKARGGRMQTDHHPQRRFLYQH